MPENVAVELTLKDLEGMAFDAALPTGHTIVLDASQDHGGENLGPRPMHVMLVALAGCTGMDVISFLRKMRQNLSWAVGYNAIALPIAAGVFASWGLVLRPEMAALSMSGSSVIVAVNALMLKRLRLPRPQAEASAVSDGQAPSSNLHETTD